MTHTNAITFPNNETTPQRKEYIAIIKSVSGKKVKINSFLVSG